MSPNRLRRTAQRVLAAKTLINPDSTAWLNCPKRVGSKEDRISSCGPRWLLTADRLRGAGGQSFPRVSPESFWRFANTRNQKEKWWRRRESNWAANPLQSLANPNSVRVRYPQMYPHAHNPSAGRNATAPPSRLDLLQRARRLLPSPARPRVTYLEYYFRFG